MSTMEAASASLGPRYAPDDPTLPNPWKGLIDGSTGVTYYWNPETNITQYEKPNDMPSSLVSGSSPAVNTSQPAQMQNSQTGSLNGMSAQYGTTTAEVNKQQPDEELKQLHHLNQFPQHSELFRQQVLQTPQIPPVGQQGSQPVQDQHYLQYGQGAQIWSSSYRPTYSQKEPTLQHQFNHQMQQPVQHMQQQSIQQLSQPLPQNLGPQAHQYLGSAVGQQSAHQFMPQEMKNTPFNQPTQEQGNQSMQHQPHHLAQNFSLPYQQANRAGYPTQEDNDFHKRMQPMVSPSKSGQVGNATVQNLSHMNGSSQMLPQIGISGQGQGTGAGVLTRDANTTGQQYTSGPEVMHRQHGLPYQNQVSPSMPQGQHFRQPPTGLNLSYGPRHHGIAGNDMYYNSSKDGLVVGSQHPKLAVVPGPTNQQSMLTGPSIQTTPTTDASASNNVPGYGWPDMKNRGSESMVMPNQALGRAPPVHPGSSDFTSLTPAAYCQRHEVTTMGDNIPAPFMTFEATRFPQEILKEVRYLLHSRSICRTLRCVQNYLQQLFLGRLHNGLFGRLHPISLPDMHSAGFLSPTPIQAQTWPIALQSRDIVAIAKTGSGKTLGYLVPAFILLMQCRNNSRNGPTVLVLAPTRELATQIQDEAVKFGQSSGISCTCLYGGAPKGPQLRDLDRGADIVVATPGRLNDILEMKRINFRQVSLLVLDEADRMLDMGFEPQIRKIVNEIPPRRQTLMFTATWPKEVRKIAGDLLVNPVQVNIGNVDELAANKAITQYVEVVPQIEKQRRLEQILASQERGSKIIVFCSTKKLCDELTRTIRRTFGAAAIHGDKSQGERDWVLNQFRSGKSPVLVATDVAARGLDIKDIRVVINYDFPTGVEDYVHRIGRTGRAGATGLAYTFLSEQDWKHVPELIKVLEGANQQVPPELREMAMRGGSIGRDRPAMQRFDSHAPGGRWDSGGGRGSGFASRGGGFASGGGGGMRDRFVARGGGMRDGFGSGTRERFGGRGAGRSEFFSGRGRRGSRAFNGPGGYEGRGRDELGANERFSSRDRYASGQGRFDHRDAPSRSSRGKSYSSSPERVRTWDYKDSKSRNRSRSRSWSRSRSRSRSRSWSRDRSCSRSPRRSYGDRGRSSSKKRSRSPSYDNYRSPNDTVDKDRRRRPSLWDEPARDDVKPNAVDGCTTENLPSQTPDPSSIVHSDPLVGGSTTSGHVMAKDMEQEGALVEQLDQSAV